MRIDAAELDPKSSYRLLTACVIPRPVAWVSTVDHGDRTNLAPFSFFGGVTSNPPTVMRYKPVAASLVVCQPDTDERISASTLRL